MSSSDEFEINYGNSESDEDQQDFDDEDEDDFGESGDSDDSDDRIPRLGQNFQPGVTFKDLQNYGGGAMVGDIRDEEFKFDKELAERNKEFNILKPDEFEDLNKKLGDDEQKTKRNTLGLLLGYHLSKIPKKDEKREFQKLCSQKQFKEILEPEDILRYYFYFK